MKKYFFILLSVLVLFPACRSSKSVYNRYYLLEIPAAALEAFPEGLQTMTGRFDVRKVEVAPAYASHQIALRDGSHSIRYFTFNEWAQRPSANLTGMLVSFLKNNNVFEFVETGRQAAGSDYVLKTKVYRMEVVQQQKEFEAFFVVEFVMMDATGNRQLFHHSAERSRMLPEKNLNMFAAAISEFFVEELTDFIMRMQAEQIESEH